MKKLLVLSFIMFSVTGCNQPDASWPLKVCTGESPEYYVSGRGGGYRKDCVKEELRCPAPLVLSEDITRAPPFRCKLKRD